MDLHRETQIRIQPKIIYFIDCLVRRNHYQIKKNNNKEKYLYINQTIDDS